MDDARDLPPLILPDAKGAEPPTDLRLEVVWLIEDAGTAEYTRNNADVGGGHGEGDSDEGSADNFE